MRNERSKVLLRRGAKTHHVVGQARSDLVDGESEHTAAT